MIQLVLCGNCNHYHCGNFLPIQNAVIQIPIPTALMSLAQTHRQDTPVTIKLANPPTATPVSVTPVDFHKQLLLSKLSEEKLKRTQTPSETENQAAQSSTASHSVSNWERQEQQPNVYQIMLSSGPRVGTPQQVYQMVSSPRTSTPKPMPVRFQLSNTRQSTSSHLPTERVSVQTKSIVAAPVAQHKIINLNQESRLTEQRSTGNLSLSKSQRVSNIKMVPIRTATLKSSRDLKQDNNLQITTAVVQNLPSADVKHSTNIIASDNVSLLNPSNFRAHQITEENPKAATAFSTQSNITQSPSQATLNIDPLPKQKKVCTLNDNRCMGFDISAVDDYYQVKFDNNESSHKKHTITKL